MRKTYEQIIAEEYEQDKQWWDDALCKGEHLVFDMDVETNPALKSEVARRNHLIYVRAVCSACPVCQECFNDAIEHSDEYGFRGGHTAEERKDYMKLHGIPSWREKTGHLYVSGGRTNSLKARSDGS